MENKLEGKLFVSFWDICLGNLPEGSFSQQHVTPDAARRRIDQARERKALLCVSDADLLAPYSQKERVNHDALRCTLDEEFGIKLSLRDFCGTYEEGSDAHYFVNPLNVVQVQNQDKLLVITCDYTLPEKYTGGPPAFRIEPTTVEFHLFEAS